jgi:transposase
MKAKHILGIDIAKRKFDVHLRTTQDQGPRHQSSFANTPKGFKALHKWLSAREVQQLHACLESTSRYGDAVATFLYQHGHRISMVNPLRTRRYADSRMVRTQNDPIDSRFIADFCASEQMSLPTWEPLSSAHRHLQDLTRARMSLTDHKHRLANQLETASSLVRRSYQRQIQSMEREILTLEKAIKELVANEPELREPIRLADSIKAVGLITAATVLAELPPIKKLPQARQAIAFAGLDPINKTSGDTVETKPRLSRMGSYRLRKALYMPAIVALRYNPIVRALGQRLQAKGKTGKCVVAAAMRKLLRLIFGVVKTGCPFDANWKNPNAPKPKAA